MKRTALITIALCFLGVFASKAVNFNFDAHSSVPASVKGTMERNISAILTEINRAGNANAPLNLSAISMEPEAKSRLNALWGDAHFVCANASYVSKCLNDAQGYQVRAIAITMKPIDSTYQGSINRELTISLNKRGVITGVRPAWENNEDVTQLLRSSGEGGVIDVARRREILKWVEDFRCYYNEKNIKALNQIYSEDALIITGSVVSQRPNVGDRAVTYATKVHYKVQDKQTYLTNLKRLFDSGKRIKVEFDHINIVKHGSKDWIYGVTLRQNWTSGTYHDEGWLFLVWDFTDSEHPQIHARTWQPEMAVATDGIFTLDDFFIP